MKKQIYRIATLLLVLITISSCGGDDSSDNNTPDSVLPSVTIAQITNITSESATSGGQVTNDGGATILEKGVCWSTSPNPDITNNKTNEGSGSSDFVSEISNLNSNTEYYIRAYATNNVGTSYSEQSVFSTQDCSITGNVYLRNQEELNTFGENNYCEIIGDLVMVYDSNSNNPITDLSPLNSLTKVSTFTISGNPFLENLDGLNITSINGFWIIANSNLTNIDALSSINSDVNMISIDENSELTNIDGLSNITTMVEINENPISINISTNDNLLNIDGLSNITSFEAVNPGWIYIEFNDVLTNINGLNNLPSNFNGSIIIGANFTLNNIEGLSNFTNIQGNLLIRSLGDGFTSLNALENLTTIGEKLDITLTKIENFDGLQNLVSVGEEINFSGNNSLISIDGLINLETADQITFNNNNFLTNLDGLANINTITNDLKITSNNALSDFCGLNEVVFANGIGGDYIVDTNGYNPTQQDILDGNCSL